MIHTFQLQGCCVLARSYLKVEAQGHIFYDCSTTVGNFIDVLKFIYFMSVQTWLMYSNLSFNEHILIF
jgi:hypothetical protein